MKAGYSKRFISIALTICLLLCSIAPSLIIADSASSVIKIDNMGDTVCADFSNNRLFTLKGTQLYLTDLSYGGGYELYDYADIAPDSTLTFLDSMVVEDKIYTLFKDSERCYLNILNVSYLQNSTNTLNFNCEKLFVLENGNVMVSLESGGSNFIFYLLSNGSYNFFPIPEKILDFYGAIDNKVYYRTGKGIKLAEFSDSSFTQSSQVINNINCAYDRVNPLEFIGGNLSAANTGEVYSVTNDSSFTKKLTFNRSVYNQSSGSLTAFLENSNLILGADGENTISAYDSNSFEYISELKTVYNPYLLYIDGSSILCIEFNNNDYYLEIFEISDFIKIEAQVVNLNDQSVYAGRTKNDLALQYSNALKGADLSQYSLSDEGSLSAPFKGTVIDSGVQGTLISFSNYLRSLCGLNGYVFGGSSTAETVGKGAVLLRTVWAENNITGHTPPRPSDMDEGFYNEAYSVCGGNISYGYGSTLNEQIKAVRSLNNDLNNASNYEINTSGYHQGFNTPGHRNCFLQRGGNKLTYGYAGRVLLQYYEYAQRNPNESGTITETGNNEAAYAWPAPGDFPLEEIDPNAVWSVYFNTDKLDLSNKSPVITITDLSTGEVFVRDTEMHDVDGQREGYATTNFWGKSICFTPPKTDSYSGKSYKVTIENLINQDNLPATVEYTVNFFEYSGRYTINGVEYDMDSNGNMTPLSVPTEPTSEVPATAEITSEAVEPTIPETTAEPIPQYLMGDVNDDGSVDTLDAIIVQKSAAEKTSLDDWHRYVADVNGDTYIDVLDAALIQKYAVEKISVFPKQ